MDGIEILRFIPGLIAWVFGIVMAVMMLRRGGRLTEKLFLAGCSLLFLGMIAALVLNNISPWIHEQQISAMTFGLIYSLSAGILSLAGFVLLVWAFWKKFWRGGQLPS